MQGCKFFFFFFHKIEQFKLDEIHQTRYDLGENSFLRCLCQFFQTNVIDVLNLGTMDIDVDTNADRYGHETQHF